MAWVWKMMQLEISETCMFLTTTKEIQEAMKQTLFQVQDFLQIGKIKTKIHFTKQRILFVIEYYNVMKGLWFELDYYQNLEMKNSEYAAMFLKFIEKV